MKNQKPNNTKAKLELTVYQKSFSSVESMIKEFKELHPEFLNIFTYEENNNPTQIANDVLMYFNNNSPDIGSMLNLPVAVSISSNKVSLKTNKFFSVGWSFKYDREGNISDLSSTIIVFTKDKNPDDLDNLIKNLNDYSWSILEKYNISP